MPAVEPRLQRRYTQLLHEHLGAATPLTTGPRALPRLSSAFASTQAAWRFFANDRISLPALARPLHQAGRQALADSAADYALLVHDWSILHYHTHTAKADQVLFSQGSDRGYELATALLVDAADGAPLAPLELRLRTSAAVYSTRAPAPRPAASHLDEVLPTLRAADALGLPRRLVHVIDCEGDSVAHLRRWHRHGHLSLVRTDGTRYVSWRGREWRMPAVVAALQREGAFAAPRAVSYHGRPAAQAVAQADVVLARPAYRNRQGRRKVIRGQPLAVRLVVSQIRDSSGALLAQGCLLTNVPVAVAAAALALWYYWRWRIESFFKLLKGAGQQVEAWQQEGGAAIAKRLVVAAMACVVAWQAARVPGPEGEQLRGLLVRLSGRQMKRGVAYTQPALLAGLWVLLAITEVLKHHDLADIRRLGALVLPASPRQDDG